MSTPHTPGPWWIEHPEYLPWDAISIRGPSGMVTTTEVPPRDKTRAGEVLANASLIAAAPDLLDLLTALWDDAYETRTAGSYRVNIEPEMAEKINTVIAKITRQERSSR